VDAPRSTALASRDTVVVPDNLSAHKVPEMSSHPATRRHRQTLPPYSQDFNPIEPAWSFVTPRICDGPNRTAAVLRGVARAARHAVTPDHCRQYFAHVGYLNQSARWV